MSKLSKQQLALTIIVCGGLLILGAKWFKENSALGFGQTVSARAKGRSNAPIKIIEYIDFQCPACAKGAKYLKVCSEIYPDKLYIEMKNYPLAMHPHAFTASLYTQCAANQNKFWPFQDLVVDRQDQWKNLANAASAFHQIAKETGLDISQLEACLQDPAVKEAILEEKNKGTSMGIQSTPTYFVNGKMVVGFKLLHEELADIFKNSSYGEFTCSY